MTPNGEKVSMEVLQKLRADCQRYLDGMEGAINDLKSVLSNVDGSWHDPDFATIREKTEALEQAIDGAKEVVSNELLPFVDSKISILEGK